MRAGGELQYRAKDRVKELEEQIKVLNDRIAELESAQFNNEQTIRRLTAQYAVAHILSESTSIENASVRILEAICESLQWELGVFWNLDRASNSLICTEVWHRPYAHTDEFESISRQRTFSPGIGLPGRLVTSAKPGWISEIDKDDNFPRALVAAKVGLQSAFGFPILIGDEVLGVMEFFAREIHQPDEALLVMMANIGNQIGDFNWHHFHGDWTRPGLHSDVRDYRS